MQLYPLVISALTLSSVASALPANEKAEEQQPGSAIKIDTTTLLQGGMVAGIVGLAGWQDYSYRARVLRDCLLNWDQNYETFEGRLDGCCDMIHTGRSRCRTSFKSAIARGKQGALDRQEYFWELQKMQWAEQNRDSGNPSPSESPKDNNAPSHLSLGSRLSDSGNNLAKNLGGAINRAGKAGNKQPSLGLVAPVGPVGVGAMGGI
ncbi:MAG: hypothetical protein M1816_004878 [Peltula sp. TS41687]|nr:MAG: hypothetical protein M1816_004878 [Peltula sp. TS41687]